MDRYLSCVTLLLVVSYGHFFLPQAYAQSATISKIANNSTIVLNGYNATGTLWLCDFVSGMPSVLSYSLRQQQHSMQLSAAMHDMHLRVMRLN